MRLLATTLIFAAAAALPMAARAQEEVSRAPIVRTAGTTPPTAAAADDQTPRQPVARGRRADSRRRGSMVGYIDDATVSSKVRMRFDAGDNIDTPDRAEFFYAKCGCYRGLPVSNPAFDPKAAGPGPGVITSLNYRQF